jgi:hypothetical protein
VKPRDVKEMVERCGLRIVVLEHNRHIKARVQRADGAESVQVFPCSVSDHRGLLNREAALRRFARG